MRVEKFDCYGSAEPEIFASIDSAHTAVTEFALDLELLSDRRTGSEVERMLPRLPEARLYIISLKIAHADNISNHRLYIDDSKQVFFLHNSASDDTGFSING